MKMTSTPWLAGLGISCAAVLISGCGMMGSPVGVPGYHRGGYPGTYPPITFLPGPGSPPWYNVGYPGTPRYPSIPIVVVKPTLPPETIPGTPEPNPFPGTPTEPTPTIPVGLPGPEVPDENSLDFWSPWPLVPQADSSTAVGSRERQGRNRASVRRRNSHALQVSQTVNSVRSVSESRRREVRQFESGGQTSPATAEELKYHGGRLIRDLYYVNLYISGDTEWSRSDVEQIDSHLSAAMRDESLNNVLLQYFENQPIRSTPLPSHPLVGYTPKTVSRGDIQNLLAWLHRQGFLRSFDLQNTVFNLLLPSGTILTVDDRAAIHVKDELNSGNGLPPFEEGDSLSGLAGYHGSVVTENQDRVYYTVSVYSQRGTNNTTNGIPVFREPWKNVVATLYHQLAESRTNPDAEEAMRRTSASDAEQYLGWVSASGLEVGDFPIRANIPLGNVFQEVPLANGSGVVPVQLLYSNAVHGPEGPISQPHSLY
ncbi:MAG: hypothetical protein R3C59_13290 [Planctomycetaceae bacterium]